MSPRLPVTFHSVLSDRGGFINERVYRARNGEPQLRSTSHTQTTSLSSFSNKFSGDVLVLVRFSFV